MNGKKHKELESLIGKDSSPISVFMSTASPSTSSGGCVPSTSAGANLASSTSSTPRSSLKDNLVSSYMAKEETLKAEIRWTLRTVEKHHSFRSSEGIEKVFQDMFGESPTAMKFSCGEKKCSYIACFGLAPYFLPSY